MVANDKNQNNELSVEQVLVRESGGGGLRGALKAGLIIVPLALAVSLYFTLHRAHGDAGAMFQTTPVIEGELSVTVTATGNLEATNEVEVGSELSGRIVKMTADYNDQVEAGKPLAYLDDSTYVANVAKSRSGVASAKAKYMQAMATKKADEKKVARYLKTRELTGGKLPSMEALEEVQADLERAVADVAAAQAEIDSAKATLDSDEADLKKTILYSPVNGIVLSKDVEVGQAVAASLEAPVIYTLAEDLRKMKLVVAVDEADVGVVRQGQAAVFTVDAYPERLFEAEIIQVRYGADENDGVITYKAVLRVDNPDMSLRPGMTATADITVQRVENSLLVPNSALRFSMPKPPMEEQPKEKGTLLGALLPGPPRHPEHDKKGEMRPPGEDEASTVWILGSDNHPQPVHVEKVATDGVLTAVQASQLSSGSRIIIGAQLPEGRNQI